MKMARGRPALSTRPWPAGQDDMRLRPPGTQIKEGRRRVDSRVGTRARLLAVLAGVIVVGTCLSLAVVQPWHGAGSAGEFAKPPPPGGYFALLPAGSYASLPGDATAAAEVHPSSW